MDFFSRYVSRDAASVHKVSASENTLLFDPQEKQEHLTLRGYAQQRKWDWALI